MVNMGQNWRITMMDNPDNKLGGAYKVGMDVGCHMDGVAGEEMAICGMAMDGFRITIAMDWGWPPAGLGIPGFPQEAGYVQFFVPGCVCSKAEVCCCFSKGILRKVEKLNKCLYLISIFKVSCRNVPTFVVKLLPNLNNGK